LIIYSGVDKDIVMARPKKSVAQDTVEEVLNSAEHFFARDGYSAARLEDMAAMAGISRPSLLYHFSAKDVLYASVVDRIFGQLAAALSGAREQGEEFEEKLYSVFTVFTTFMAERPDVASILVREMIANQGPGHQRLLELGEPLIDGVETWIVAHGRVKRGVSVRTVIMNIVSDVLLRHASGELGRLLWRGQSGAGNWAIVEALLVEEKR